MLFCAAPVFCSSPSLQFIDQVLSCTVDTAVPHRVGGEYIVRRWLTDLWWCGAWLVYIHIHTYRHMHVCMCMWMGAHVHLCVFLVLYDT